MEILAAQLIYSVLSKGKESPNRDGEDRNDREEPSIIGLNSQIHKYSTQCNYVQRKPISFLQFPHSIYFILPYITPIHYLN